MTTPTRRLLTALAIPAFFAVSAVAALAATESSTPRLSISIPTIKFSEIARSGGTITVAWLPEYLIGVYNYGLTLGGALAVVMMMWGGFKWMTGDKSGGQDKIKNASVGLVILFGAYIILSVVSPTLTQLKTITINTVAKQSLQILSSGQLSKIAGLGPVLTAQEMNAKIKADAKEKGGEKFACFVSASVANESGGRQTALGHDENATSVDFEVGARKKFINSGVLYSGATFEPLNCTNRKCQNQGPQNDDTSVDLANPPDYGLDWRYSHGFGAGQSTIFGDVNGKFNPRNQPCPGKEDQGRGFRMGSKCFSIPDLFKAENQVAIMLDHYKRVWGLTNDGEDPAAGYVAYAGTIEKDNPIIVDRVKKYQACVAGLNK
jgi:hypothetical protein